jgi:hypothetical protein
MRPHRPAEILERGPAQHEIKRPIANGMSDAFPA